MFQYMLAATVIIETTLKVIVE